MKDSIGYKTKVFIKPSYYDGKNMWIIKATDMNRGRCIRFSNNVNEIYDIMKSYYDGISTSNKKLVNEDNKKKVENNENDEDDNKEDNEYNDDNEIENNDNNDEEKNQKIKDDKKLNNNTISKKKKTKSKSQNKIIKVVKETTSSSNKKEIKIDKELPLILDKKDMKDMKEVKEVKDIKDDKDTIRDTKKEKRLAFKKYRTSNILLQKYIEKPLLYRERKFDIRIWVVLTHRFEVWVFKEGHLKACSTKFKLQADDAFTHITNYSFQKYNKDFSKHEIGNEISFQAWQVRINQQTI